MGDTLSKCSSASNTKTPPINCHRRKVDYYHVAQCSIEDILDDVMDDVLEEVGQYYEDDEDDDEKGPDISTQPVPQRVATIDSEFKSISVLGRGSSSRVLKVKELKDQQIYALKELPVANWTQFAKEVELLKMVEHPHVLKFKDCWRAENRVYVRSEYLGGGTLLDKITKMKRFKERKAIGYTRDILSAVAHMHLKGVVHRDLKAKNICFTQPGSKGVLKIIDLGDGKIVEEGNIYNDFVGTIHYLSPESLRKSGYTAEELRKSDCWAVGIIAYLMVCGRPPFTGTSHDEIVQNILRSKYKALTFPKGTSANFRDFISKLLCYDSKKRMGAEDAQDHLWLLDDVPCTMLNGGSTSGFNHSVHFSTSLSAFRSPEYSVNSSVNETFNIEMLEESDVDDILQAIEDRDRNEDPILESDVDSGAVRAVHIANNSAFRPDMGHITSVPLMETSEAFDFD